MGTDMYASILAKSVTEAINTAYPQAGIKFMVECGPDDDALLVTFSGTPVTLEVEHGVFSVCEWPEETGLAEVTKAGVEVLYDGACYRAALGELCFALMRSVGMRPSVQLMTVGGTG